DWTRMYYKDNAVYQKHNISVSGGDKKNQYYVNAGIFDQPGLYSWGDDGYKRYNVLANLNSQVADWISFNFGAKYGKAKTNAPIGMVGLERTYTWSQFIDFWPTMPMYNIDGSVANPLVLVLEQGGRIITENNDLWLNIGAEIEPVKGWKTNLYYRYNNRWGSSDRNPKPVPVPIPNGTMGNIGEAATGLMSTLNQGNYYQLGAFTSYEKQLGDHYFKALVGYEQDKDYKRALIGSKMNLITEQVPSMSTATGDVRLRDEISHWSTEGVFGRLNYNYNEKYLFEFSARYDGSSRFAPGSRWGFFPSASVGYNIAKENFWAPLESYINTFKIRGSYGSLGNQRTLNYLYLPTMPVQYRLNSDNYANPGYIIGNEVPLYALMPNIVTDGLTWETITTLDLGLDAGFLNNRLNLTFDWYNRVTSDMMGVVLELPSLLGTAVPWANNATLSTKGLELSLAWQDRLNSNFSYDARLTIGRSRTVITDYLAEAVNINGWYKGKVYGEIWGLTTDRIMQDKDESMPDQSAYHAKWGPGDIIYKDLNGDGVIDEGSRTLNDHGDLSVIANTTPKFNYGIMAGFRWKNLDFNMFWQGIGKRDFLPNTYSEYFWGLMNAPNNSGIFKGGKMLDYWRPADETNIFGPNTDSYFPRPYFSAERNKNIRDQSRYVLNAAYLRLKNLQVGYTIPSKTLQRVFINRARVYFSAENLLTFSKLPKMYEPETVVASSTREGTGGIDMGEIYPINQMFSFGVNLTF
ncbi:MAG: SusC/RagA family TonB-linked outer membrane protein, partial [Chitinophagaceae bacterium]|nr:SusC/RagA family TonB-linked outer membrane protein [Chitinophagaceae bacterium]